ncbi:catalase family protein [Paracoccaceae bacterium Fryx2]|nr:catalase family protein [Paracoccaceae bacterium Fryx2]
MSRLPTLCLCVAALTAATDPGFTQNAPYPEADSLLGERIGATEAADARALIETLSATIRAEYTAGGARRDAHPKAHGCVSATFTVDADIPAALRVGIFQPGASYDTVVRFSNGSPDAYGDDRNGDTRGMALKLRGVAGDKLFADPASPDAQDIVLISSPVFFVNDSHGYTQFFQIVDAGRTLPMLKIPFILGWQGSVNAYTMLKQKIANPLLTQYYSVTPYQFGLGGGRGVVKYSARPCVAQDQAVPEAAGKNFLRAALRDSLAAGPACMEFLIQSRGTTGLAVEDVITPWDEAVAPFVRVAEITIHQQQFDTAALNAACEARSFNPWHALAEHRPLGTVNRMRRVVYQAISDLRHEMNQ